MKYDVLILGGGAAGLMAGVQLAKSGLHTAILEKGPRVGKKLAATGNGRCNLTNLRARPADYGRAADFVRPALEAFPPQKVLLLFREMGVPYVADEEGRAYPAGNQATGVLDVLRASCAENGCEEIVECAVEKLVRKGDMWQVRCADGRIFSAPKVLMAMGGQAAPNLGGCPDGVRLLKDMGLQTKPCFPALTPLKCDNPHLKALKGIRAAGRVSLLIDKKSVASEDGELLFQDYGLSGIAVMQLSGAAAEALSKGRKVELQLNLSGGEWMDTFSDLTARRSVLPNRPLENFLTGWMNKRLGQTLLKMIDCRDMTLPARALTDTQLRELARIMTGWTLPVTASPGFAQAQVTRGGVDTREIDPHTMLSRRHPGLYIAGEVLDVDGPCGGYNLQWAWSSALTAVQHILR